MQLNDETLGTCPHTLASCCINHVMFTYISRENFFKQNKKRPLIWQLYKFTNCLTKIDVPPSVEFTSPYNAIGKYLSSPPMHLIQNSFRIVPFCPSLFSILSAIQTKLGKPSRQNQHLKLGWVH